MSHSYTKVPNTDDTFHQDTTTSSNSRDSNENEIYSNESQPLTSAWTELEDGNQCLLQPMTPLAGSSQQQQQQQQQRQPSPQTLEPTKDHTSAPGDRKRTGLERFLGPFLSITSSASSSTSSSHVQSTSIESSASGSSAPPRRLSNMLTSDGVFSNISAKPQVDPKQGDDEQHPPAYDSALQDITPPYFEMTVSTPSVYGDEILVNGLPVGNFFQFMWNVIVSVGFQFLGAMLTYLLHNSHASKSGSMVGFGITLLNFGIRMSGNLNSMSGGDIGGPGEISQVDKPPFVDDTGYIVGYGSDTAEMDWLDADIENRYVSLFLMISGWVIIVKALAEYATAKRTERLLSARLEEGRDLESEFQIQHLY